MKNLFSSTYSLFLLFFILSCDDQIGVVEILSLSASDSTVRIGKEIILYCDAKTNKTDKLRYSWESSAGTVISGNKDSALWTAPNKFGYYIITCKVSDDYGSSDAETIIINVGQFNAPPEIYFINDSGLQVAPNSLTNIICEASDPDGDEITYRWIAEDGFIQETNSDSIITWSAPSLESNYNITCIVTDTYGSSDTASIELSVIDLNQAPSISFITEDSLQFFPSSENVFEVSTFDPEGDEIFLNWSIQSGTLDPVYDIANWLLPSTAGFYNISCTASDPSGSSNTATLTAIVCSLSTTNMSEINVEEWNFEGSALWNDSENTLELTPVETGQVGTAFNTIDTISGFQAEITFDFYIGDGSGADGLTFTALDVDRMTTFLGESGGGIGYGGLPGWTIEIDTYYNGGSDPTPDDHLAFTFDGNSSEYILWSALPEMEDNGWHTIKIRVNAPHVYVEVDEITYINEEVEGWTNFNAIVGFTAGTGGATNRHAIKSLIVSDTNCE